MGNLVDGAPLGDGGNFRDGAPWDGTFLWPLAATPDKASAASVSPFGSHLGGIGFHGTDGREQQPHEPLASPIFWDHQYVTLTISGPQTGTLIMGKNPRGSKLA